MKKITLLTAFLVMLLKITTAQQSFVNMAIVFFSDGKCYHGKILQETPDMIRIQFLRSNNTYEFNKLGVITKSTGTYKAGSLVKLISIHEFIKDIYDEENTIYPYGFIGVRFGDGRLFYALTSVTDGIQNNTINNVDFLHSNSIYNFIKENGKWKVAFTRGGGYPVGHVITQLYTLQNLGRVFYADGLISSPNFMERKPDANN